MTKQELLSLSDFGKRVAEEEAEELGFYFVETDQWKRVFAGEVDVIYGAKGSGKSAIYSLVLRRQTDLLKQGIAVLPAENPHGTPVFRDLVTNPPASESEFRALWKMYFLSLLAEHLRGTGNASASGKLVIRSMEDARLLQKDTSLSGKLRAAVDYVSRCFKAEAVEGGIKIDPVTGLPEGITGKIILREPDTRGQEAGLISADRLLAIAQEALKNLGQRVWLVLDRLDVVFADSPGLEGNALRALFRVYLDLLAFDRLSLKIFLRKDIWQRITTEPFREASHITRNITISWNQSSLLNLVVRRLLHNKAICDRYQVNVAEVLGNIAKQTELFYRIFPPQLDAGPKQPTTFDWILTRTRDGTRESEPRELIHLLSAARGAQLKSLEIGAAEPPGEALFDRSALKEALLEVSAARFEQTLCAEFPQYRDPLRKLEREKTEQKPETLAGIWRVSREEALQLANQLCEIGFFERRGTKEEPIFWVPFLYRGALSMVQGSAE